MKKTLILSTALSLFICGFCASPSFAKAKQTPTAAKLEKALNAFNDICLSTAPTFNNAKASSQKYGITKFMNLGPAMIGDNADKSINAQINPSVECAIGVSTVGGDEVLPAFVQFIAKKAQKIANPLPKTTPFSALINGKIYIFHLDRHGGDTFVMVLAKK